MNGFDATRYIRTNFEVPVKSIPVIALTASVLRTDLDKCREAGMDSYIAKPFKAAQLISGIAQVLNISGRTASDVRTEAQSKNEAVSAHYATGAADLNYLHKYCDGDRERMQMYIKIYLKAANGFEEKLKAAVDSKDRAAIASLMHNFKPKWITMGMNKSVALGQKAELLCVEDGNDGLLEECLSSITELNRLSIEELSGLGTL
jgi:CheY-like chemotaxis protein